MADDHVPAADDGNRSDLDSVQSLAEFAQACDRLRAGRSYADLRKAARPRSLPAATLSDLLNARSTPTRDTVITFFNACGLDDAAQRPWLAAWERAAHGHQPRPVGAVRVREARPRLLGVHAAIRVSQDMDEVPPYVPRDVDADLRTAITAAATRGGFVLLVGGSSVGKTRALFEAVRAVLSNWWLLHPADVGAVRAVADGPPSRTVLWLDEVQRYLNVPGGLPAGLVRDLVASGVVLVATVWPDEYSSRTMPRQPDQHDTYANDRELLGIAEVITVSATLSNAERRRAEALAADRRIRIALDTPDAGFTQVLAAGPELVRWWENAPDQQCYGKAIITAALDARRVGARAPLARDFLAAAAPGYLSAPQQATAPPDWLEHALSYATTQLHGATAALCPVAAGMGKIAGYNVADYLHQHALRVRRTARLPDSAWQALIDHHDSDDARTLAENAERRGRPAAAYAFHTRAADAGDRVAAAKLAALLAGQGRIDELQRRAKAGDEPAAQQLVGVLVKGLDVDGLRQRACAGDRAATTRLIVVLTEHGDVEGLRKLSDAGNREATTRMTDVLAKRGDADELRKLADAGDGYAVHLLIDVLAQRGDVDELRRRINPRDDHAAGRLIEVLAKRGDADELRQRADAGDRHALYCLINVLAQRGDVEELRVHANGGHAYAAARWADLLVQQGDIHLAMSVLRGHVNAAGSNDWSAMVEYWTDRGDNDALSDLQMSGYGDAADRLADLFAEQPDMDELGRLADVGHARSARLLASLLAEQGGESELRRRAEVGDMYSLRQMVDLLVGRGDVEDALAILHRRAVARDSHARGLLADLLAREDRVDELRALADTGDAHAAGRLVAMLAERGRFDELKGEVYAGTWGAARLVEVD